MCCYVMWCDVVSWYHVTRRIVDLNDYLWCNCGGAEYAIHCEIMAQCCSTNRPLLTHWSLIRCDAIKSKSRPQSSEVETIQAQLNLIKRDKFNCVGPTCPNISSILSLLLSFLFSSPSLFLLHSLLPACWIFLSMSFLCSACLCLACWILKGYRWRNGIRLCHYETS